MEVQKQKFVARYSDDGKFTPGFRTYLEYRDLGLREATGGQYHAHVIRPAGPCPKESNGSHYHDLGFQWNYVLKGWVKMNVEGQGEFTVHQGGCWLQPPAIPHALLDYSDDAEWIEVTSPADFNTEEI